MIQKIKNVQLIKNDFKSIIDIKFVFVFFLS